MSLRSYSSQSAFSLLELLVTIAIMTLLMVAAVPAFHAIAGAHAVTRATYDVMGILELARSEAVARQTYVWVGFDNDATDNELIAGAVYSRDGSGTNISSSNLAPLSKAIHVRNVKLASWSELKAPTKALFIKQLPASAATNTAAISFNVSNVAFEKRTITFTPRGEATLKCSVGPDDGFDPYIDVGFQQAHGGVAQPGADDAAVLIEGATGISKILQIQ
jgi:prepilin-type N-terminal cleavage/methylation domain-containing protein